MEEARYSLSLRNSPDYDSGILTIRADDPAEFRQAIAGMREAGGVDDLIGSFFQLDSKRAQEFVRQWNDAAVGADVEKTAVVSEKLAAAKAKTPPKTTEEADSGGVSVQE